MSSNPNLNEIDYHVSRNRNDVVYAQDVDGNFTFLSRAGELLLGYSDAEVRRMNIAHVVCSGNSGGRVASDFKRDGDTDGDRLRN